MPIPCLYDSSDKEKQNPIINQKLIETIKKLLRTDGNIDFWWSKNHDKILAQTISNDQNVQIQKSNDILDIWFDSGSSFYSVDNMAKADTYCEGIDQFSGWFQSSLLLSIAFNEAAPYKSLLVHGFVVDEQNRNFILMFKIFFNKIQNLFLKT